MPEEETKSDEEEGAARQGNRPAATFKVKPGFNSVFQSIVLCQRVLDMR